MALNGRYGDMWDCWLIGCQETTAEKRVWQRSAPACGGMPWNGKEEKITGMGCNHHLMMVATEKRDPVNITFYLSKVISPMFIE